MTTINLLDEARFRPMRTTTPLVPTQDLLRERAVAADKRDARAARRRRALTTFLIVAPYVGVVAMALAFAR